MKFNEDLIIKEWLSVNRFLREHGFTRNTYEALKRKVGKGFIAGSKAYDLYKLMKEKKYIVKG